jgi:hypothetical protein
MRVGEQRARVRRGCNQERPLAAALGSDATRAPVNRGVELCGEVVGSPQAVITMQVSVLAARPSSAIARPSRVGLPPPCRTRSSALERMVPVESDPRTRRMSSQCAAISFGLMRLRARPFSAP